MGVHQSVFECVIKKCSDLDPIAVAVVSPLSEVAIRGAIDAARAGLINPYLIGPQAKIASVAREHGIEIAPYPIVDVTDDIEAAQRGVELCREDACQALMKGSLQTHVFLKPIVADDTGLHSKRRISHAFVVDSPSFPRTLIITDAAINVYPKLEEKADIVQNAIDLAHLLGIATPKVAILSAIETVSSTIASTIDAAALCKMADRGQITGGVLDGPLAFDDATEPEAARIKQIDSPLAGQADILVVPDVESGNMLVKQFQSLAGVEAAGVVLGARVPIILTSRAANPKIRQASTAIAVLLAQKDRQELSAVASGIGVLLQSKAWLSSNGSEPQ
ncbi:MAG TPA: bifunctional enoyl-CoA hydratase/phosphate acetyltransferase [Candidatus Acidoferrales bacterium]|nr:bifunctional enoyl-CoA hydratase/phosphate acetyltransferase [Candidatus Acidoferrales bacterium]